ncbi:putative Histidine kinase [Rhodospirillaceae bacterium LM-1]|nr:putative Histidine kinase [Rhodospirillaceae bacterium LM-1]
MIALMPQAKGLDALVDDAARLLRPLIEGSPHGAALADPVDSSFVLANTIFIERFADLTEEEASVVKQRIGRSEPDKLVQGHHVLTLSPLPISGRSFVLVWIDEQPTSLDSAESRLRDSERRLAAILDTAPVPLTVTSLESSQVLFANERAAKMLGYDKNTIIGKPSGLFYLNPADRIRMINQLLDKEEVLDFETVFRHADGHPVSVLFSAVPFYMENERGLLSAITDISRRKEMEEIVRASEERYRTIIDSTSEGFWMIDGGTHVTLDVNQSLCDMLGHAREDLLGSALLDFADESNKDLLTGYIGRILAGERLDFDIELRTAEGHNLPCHFKSARLSDPLLHSVQVYAFITDITQRKEAQRVLQESKDEALAAAKARSEFLAVMSHEIRTPMNGVLGMTGLLLGQPLGDKQRHYAEIIQHSGESLMVLLNDILDLSKVEAGKLVLESIPFDPRQMFLELHHLMSPRAAEKNLQLLKRVDNGVPEFLLGDPSRLRQILLNLISNALKFTERGSISFALESLGQTSAGVAHLRFSVADTGIGIDADVQNLLFREFAQADASIARRFGGTGLGLAISARLAEAMGGKIEISSQANQGSLFWIDLDLPVAQSLPVREETAIDVPSLTLLVAEDNAINRQVISGILEGRGHTVLLVEDGAQAVKALEMGQFDAVLMDGWMPVMDGIEAARCIRALKDPAKAATPIIAMTANVSESDIRSYLDAGMDDALGKPVDLARLDLALHKVASRLGRTVSLNVGSQDQTLCTETARDEESLAPDLLDDDILSQLCETLGFERLEEGMSTLPAHWRDRCEAIVAAGRKIDRQALLRLAHDLKGTSGSFGLKGLSFHAMRLETAAKMPQYSDAEVQALALSLPDIVEKAIAALDGWRQSHR